MNENQNQTGENQVKRGAGRPRNANITRVLKLDADTMKPIGKGRLNHGKKLIEVHVQRCIKASQYEHGTTTIVGEPKEIVVTAKEKSAPESKINVVVIESKPQSEISAESEPTQKMEDKVAAEQVAV